MRRWAQSVLDRVKPMRKRTPAGLVLWGAQTTNGAEHVSPGSAHLMGRAEHELCDMGDAVRAQGYRTKKAPEGPEARRRVPNGRCALKEACEEKTKTSQLNCPSCNGGRGAFYHLPCFFKRHRCVYVGTG